MENQNLGQLISANTVEVKHLTGNLSKLDDQFAALDERLDALETRLTIIETRTKTLARAGYTFISIVTAVGAWLGFNIPSFDLPQVPTVPQSPPSIERPF